MNLNNLLIMHGYGVYVWPAYCITLFVFGMNLFSTLNEKHKTKKRIQQYLTSNK